MICVLSGANTYLINKELNSYLNEFRSKYGDSIERFDGAEINSTDDLVDAVRSVSLLEPRKLVVVRNFGQCKELLDKIETVVEQTADSTDLLLVDEKLDKRTSAYKYLQKNVEVKIFNESAPYELEKWVEEEIKNRGGEISHNDAKLFIARIGTNQLRLQNEIDKIVLSGQKINKQLIEEMVDLTPQGKVFAMLDELFKGSSKTAWDLYQNQRAQGEEPQKIIGMITWHLQQLTYAVFSPVKTTAAMTENGMSPYTARSVLQQAKNITKSDIKYFTNQLAEIDYMSKTNADVESALAVYFSDVCSVAKN